MLLTISLLSRLFILLLVLPVLSHLRAPSCFLALWGSSCIVSLSCGFPNFPLASFFWLWSATSRSFPWDLSAGSFRGFLPHGLQCLECHEFISPSCTLKKSKITESSFCSFPLVLLPKNHQTIMGQFLENLHNNSSPGILFSPLGYLGTSDKF